MMNIKDLDFQKELGESSQILGGQVVSDNASETIRQRFLSLTGQLVGIFDSSYNATATGTNQADVSFVSNFTGETVNQLSIGYGTTTKGFATTPGT